MPHTAQQEDMQRKKLTNKKEAKTQQKWTAKTKRHRHPHHSGPFSSILFVCDHKLPVLCVSDWFFSPSLCLYDLTWGIFYAITLGPLLYACHMHR